MAIDYIIDYDCVPKQQFGTESIKERLKGRERATTIIRMFREAGDERDPDEMGFEFTRSTPEGTTEKELIVVQDMLDNFDELKPVMPHCQGCPANRTGMPFGCMGFVQYPISGEAEEWLLNQLPSIDEPLVWLLLKQGVENFAYDGLAIDRLRKEGDTYFLDKFPANRFLGEFTLNANQIFEMIFSVGDIIPNHGAVLLLFYNAIERSELEAPQIMALAPADAEKIQAHPYLHQIMQGDDRTLADFKEFFEALWVSWALNVKLLIDA